MKSRFWDVGNGQGCSSPIDSQIMYNVEHFTIRSLLDNSIIVKKLDNVLTRNMEKKLVFMKYRMLREISKHET